MGNSIAAQNICGKVEISSSFKRNGAFRTMSHEAVAIITGIMPPDIMAIELKNFSTKQKALGMTKGMTFCGNWS